MACGRHCAEDLGGHGEESWPLGHRHVYVSSPGMEHVTRGEPCGLQFNSFRSIA